MSRRINRARLDELIDEATVDCYGEEEEHTALLSMIEERVVCPFRAKVIGETVEVIRFEWAKFSYGMFAVCRHKERANRVDINSLKWIEHFRRALNGSPLTRRGASVVAKRADLRFAIEGENRWRNQSKPKRSAKRDLLLN